MSKAYFANEGEPLTELELSVLERVANGLVSKEIGDELGYSPDHVYHEISSIFVKLGVHTRAHAVAEGFRKGILK